MTQIEKLIKFEIEYQGLYDVRVNGVPVYAALRDVVNARVNGVEAQESSFESEHGKVSFRRVIDSVFKLKKYKKAKTAVFTSSVYRRDKGRNLAAEFLMDKYPDTVVFEWPARNESFDFAYLTDNNRDKYCPLEWYLIKYKLYKRLHRKEYQQYCNECIALLDNILPEKTDDLPRNFKTAIEYLKSAMPDSFAETKLSQKLFKKLFRKYKNLEHAIDFWGSARENIIPVLPGNPESVELQHGIITKGHPGYIYPEFVRVEDDRFFGRTLLVYGEKVKEILTQNSIFKPEQIEVIGNPRIIKYKKEFPVQEEERNLILFASQPYEQSRVGTNYYQSMIDYLRFVQKYLEEKSLSNSFKLCIKLHPREENSVKKIYTKSLGNIDVFDNSSQLYEILNNTFLQLTVSSTTLYEAALFGVPTALFSYKNGNFDDVFGFSTFVVSSYDDVKKMLDILFNKDTYDRYVCYLQEQTRYFM